MTAYLKRITDGSIDLASLAVWPYVLGFLVVLIYYSRFRLFSFNPISAQYILTGLYVILLYFALPYLIMRWLPLAGRSWSLILKSGTVLLLDTAILLAVLEQPWRVVSGITLLTLAALQIGYLVNWNGIVDLRMRQKPLKTATFALGAVLHFALFAFPELPYYYGGGKPTRVYVFLDKDYENLLSHPYKETSYAANLLVEWPAYPMALLFETSEEYVFLRSITKKATIQLGADQLAADTTTRHIVRIKKAKVIRLEYPVKGWVTLRKAGQL